MSDVIIQMLPSGVDILENAGFSKEEISELYNPSTFELNLSKLDMKIQKKQKAFDELQTNYLYQNITLLLIKDCSVNFSDLPRGFGSLENIETAARAPETINYIRDWYFTGFTDEEKSRAHIYVDQHPVEGIWLSFAASGQNIEEPFNFSNWFIDKYVDKDLQIAVEHHPWSSDPLRKQIPTDSTKWGFGLTDETLLSTYNQYFADSDTMTYDAWRSYANNGLSSLVNIYQMKDHSDWKRDFLSRNNRRDDKFLIKNDAEERDSASFQEFFVNEFMPSMAKAANEQGMSLEYYTAMMQRSGWNAGDLDRYNNEEVKLSEIQNFISSTFYHAETSPFAAFARDYVENQLFDAPEEYKALNLYQKLLAIADAKGNGKGGQELVANFLSEHNIEIPDKYEDKVKLLDYIIDYLQDPSQKTESALGNNLSEATPVDRYAVVRFPIPTFGITDMEADTFANAMILKEEKLRQQKGENSQEFQTFLGRYSDLLQYSHELVTTQEGLDAEKAKFQELTNQYLDRFAIARLQPLIDPDYEINGMKISDEQRKKLWEESGLAGDSKLKWLYNYSLLWKNTLGDWYWTDDRNKQIENGINATIEQLTTQYEDGPTGPGKSTRMLFEDVIYDVPEFREWLYSQATSEEEKALLDQIAKQGEALDPYINNLTQKRNLIYDTVYSPENNLEFDLDFQTMSSAAEMDYLRNEVLKRNTFGISDPQNRDEELLVQLAAQTIREVPPPIQLVRPGSGFPRILGTDLPYSYDAVLDDLNSLWDKMHDMGMFPEGENHKFDYFMFYVGELEKLKQGNTSLSITEEQAAELLPLYTTYINPNDWNYSFNFAAFTQGVNYTKPEENVASSVWYNNLDKDALLERIRAVDASGAFANASQDEREFYLYYDQLHPGYSGKVYVNDTETTNYTSLEALIHVQNPYLFGEADAPATYRIGGSVEASIAIIERAENYQKFVEQNPLWSDIASYNEIFSRIPESERTKILLQLENSKQFLFNFDQNAKIKDSQYLSGYNIFADANGNFSQSTTYFNQDSASFGTKYEFDNYLRQLLVISSDNPSDGKNNTEINNQLQKALDGILSPYMTDADIAKIYNQGAPDYLKQSEDSRTKQEEEFNQLTQKWGEAVISEDILNEFNIRPLFGSDSPTVQQFLTITDPSTGTVPLPQHLRSALVQTVAGQADFDDKLTTGILDLHSDPHLSQYLKDKKYGPLFIKLVEAQLAEQDINNSGVKEFEESFNPSQNSIKAGTSGRTIEQIILDNIAYSKLTPGSAADHDLATALATAALQVPAAANSYIYDEEESPNLIKNKGSIPEDLEISVQKDGRLNILIDPKNPEHLNFIEGIHYQPSSFGAGVVDLYTGDKPILEGVNWVTEISVSSIDKDGPSFIDIKSYGGHLNSADTEKMQVMIDAYRKDPYAFPGPDNKYIGSQEIIDIAKQADSAGSFARASEEEKYAYMYFASFQPNYKDMTVDADRKPFPDYSSATSLLTSQNPYLFDLVDKPQKPGSMQQSFAVADRANNYDRFVEQNPLWQYADYYQQILERVPEQDRQKILLQIENGMELMLNHDENRNLKSHEFLAPFSMFLGPDGQPAQDIGFITSQNSSMGQAYQLDGYIRQLLVISSDTPTSGLSNKEINNQLERVLGEALSPYMNNADKETLYPADIPEYNTPEQSALLDSKFAELAKNEKIGEVQVPEAILQEFGLSTLFTDSATPSVASFLIATNPETGRFPLPLYLRYAVSNAAMEYNNISLEFTNLGLDSDSAGNLNTLLKDKELGGLFNKLAQSNLALQDMNNIGVEEFNQNARPEDYKLPINNDRIESYTPEQIVLDSLFNSSLNLNSEAGDISPEELHNALITAAGQLPYSKDSFAKENSGVPEDVLKHSNVIPSGIEIQTQQDGRLNIFIDVKNPDHLNFVDGLNFKPSDKSDGAVDLYSSDNLVLEGANWSNYISISTINKNRASYVDIKTLGGQMNAGDIEKLHLLVNVYKENPYAIVGPEGEYIGAEDIKNKAITLDKEGAFAEASDDEKFAYLYYGNFQPNYGASTNVDSSTDKSRYLSLESLLKVENPYIFGDATSPSTDSGAGSVDASLGIVLRAEQYKKFTLNNPLWNQVSNYQEIFDHIPEDQKAQVLIELENSFRLMLNFDENRKVTDAGYFETFSMFPDNDGNRSRSKDYLTPEALTKDPSFQLDEYLRQILVITASAPDNAYSQKINQQLQLVLDHTLMPYMAETDIKSIYPDDNIPPYLNTQSGDASKLKEEIASINQDFGKTIIPEAILKEFSLEKIFKDSNKEPTIENFIAISSNQSDTASIPLPPYLQLAILNTTIAYHSTVHEMESKNPSLPDNVSQDEFLSDKKFGTMFYELAKSNLTNKEVEYLRTALSDKGYTLPDGISNPSEIIQWYFIQIEKDHPEIRDLYYGSFFSDISTVNSVLERNGLGEYALNSPGLPFYALPAESATIQEITPSQIITDALFYSSLGISYDSRDTATTLYKATDITDALITSNSQAAYATNSFATNPWVGSTNLVDPDAVIPSGIRFQSYQNGRLGIYIDISNKKHLDFASDINYKPSQQEGMVDLYSGDQLIMKGVNWISDIIVITNDEKEMALFEIPSEGGHLDSYYIRGMQQTINMLRSDPNAIMGEKGLSSEVSPWHSTLNYYHYKDDESPEEFRKWLDNIYLKDEDGVLYLYSGDEKVPYADAIKIFDAGITPIHNDVPYDIYDYYYASPESSHDEIIANFEAMKVRLRDAIEFYEKYRDYPILDELVWSKKDLNGAVTDYYLSEFDIDTDFIKKHNPHFYLNDEGKLSISLDDGAVILENISFTTFQFDTETDGLYIAPTNPEQMTPEFLNTVVKNMSEGQPISNISTSQSNVGIEPNLVENNELSFNFSAPQQPRKESNGNALWS